jgi:hypothetical protein
MDIPGLMIDNIKMEFEEIWRGARSEGFCSMELNRVEYMLSLGSRIEEDVSGPDIVPTNDTCWSRHTKIITPTDAYTTHEFIDLHILACNETMNKRILKAN